MFTSPLLGFFMEALHIVVQLLTVHPPHAAAADLYRRQLSRTHERVDLGHADTQIGRHVIEGEKARLDLDLAIAGGLFWHRKTIAADDGGYLHLESFAAVWRKWAPDRIAAWL